MLTWPGEKVEQPQQQEGAEVHGKSNAPGKFDPADILPPSQIPSSSLDTTDQQDMEADTPKRKGAVVRQEDIQRSEATLQLQAPQHKATNIRSQYEQIKARLCETRKHRKPTNSKTTDLGMNRL